MLRTPFQKPREVQHLPQSHLRASSVFHFSWSPLTLFSCLSLQAFHLLGHFTFCALSTWLFPLPSLAQSATRAWQAWVAAFNWGLGEMKASHNTARNNFKFTPDITVSRKLLAILHHMGTFYSWCFFMDPDVLPCSWDLLLSPLTTLCLLFFSVPKLFTCSL